jgi:UDP-2-acetamido-3-amino-2,3-dideoxy-glucuronate N-acetyltransferase
MSHKPFVHEKAMCESPEVGEGTRIWAYAHVMAKAVVGKNCNLGEGVFVENGAVVGDGCTIKNGVAIWDRVHLEADVFVGPNVAFTNALKPRAFLKLKREEFLPTRVSRGATLGANCTIVCGVTIGEYALVGAGAVVVKDVPPHALIVGNPGRLAGRVCFCGERLDQRAYCSACQLSLEENSREKVAARS